MLQFSHLRKNALYAALMVCLGYSASLWAAEAVPAEDEDAVAAGMERIETETVVVTASRTEQQLLDVNASISIVDSAKAATMGRDSIPELVRNEPGVSLVSDGTPGAKRIALRGENASRTLILIDGQRIDDQKNKSGAPLLINPYFIDRIEVVKGPSSVLYGSDAIGGIVNVIPKKASAEPFTFETGIGYSGANGSFSEYANISGTLERFKYVVGAFNTNAGDLIMSDRERLDNTSYNAAGLNGDFSYDLNDHLTVGYAGEYFDSDAETSTTVDDATYGMFRGEIPKWNRQKHKLYLKAYDINDYLAAVDASVYYQSNDKDFRSWPQRGLEVGLSNEQDTYGGNLQLEFSLGDMFYLVTGYEGRVEKLKSSSDIDVAMGPMFNANFHIKDDGYQQNNHALYALLSTYITDELTLNTGIRYNYVDINAGTTSMSGMLQAGNQSARPLVMNSDYEDESQSKTLGSIGLVYRPFDHGAFRLNWSQGFRVPNIQELFLMTSTGTLQTGNPELQPETSDNFEFGFRWEEPNGLIADAALFYTQADNYIETVQQGQFYTYRNIAEANSYGLELAVSYLLASGLEPYANITLMEREYKTTSGSSKNTGTPKFWGNTGLRYHHSSFEVDGFANFATRTKNDNLEGTSYFGNNEYGGYVTLNLRVSTKLGPKDQFTVYGSIENILDKNYQTTELIHEPGRFITLGVNARF